MERCDPYLVLGVSRSASAEEITRAFKRAARASHPDSGGAASSDRFRAVTDAYDELRAAERRAGYDQPLRRAGSTVRYAAPGSQHVVLGEPAPANELHLSGLERRLQRPTGFIDGTTQIGLEVWKWRTF